MRGTDRKLRIELGTGGRQTHRDISTPHGIRRCRITTDGEGVAETLLEKLNQEIRDDLELEALD